MGVMDCEACLVGESLVSVSSTLMVRSSVTGMAGVAAVAAWLAWPAWLVLVMTSVGGLAGDSLSSSSCESAKGFRTTVGRLEQIVVRC